MGRTPNSRQFPADCVQVTTALSYWKKWWCYHDDEDVGDVESSASGGMGAARERRMFAVLNLVSLVELRYGVLERLYLVVKSPLLSVHEWLHVDGRPL